MTGGIGQQQLGYIIMKFSYRIEQTRMTNDVSGRGGGIHMYYGLLLE